MVRKKCINGSTRNLQICIYLIFFNVFGKKGQSIIKGLKVDNRSLSPTFSTLHLALTSHNSLLKSLGHHSSIRKLTTEGNYCV